MKFPSKVTPYKASILSKFPTVLSVLETENMKSKVADVGEFLEILDCLFALGRIELNEEEGVLRYVD